LTTFKKLSNLAESDSQKYRRFDNFQKVVKSGGIRFMENTGDLTTFRKLSNLAESDSWKIQEI